MSRKLRERGEPSGSGAARYTFLQSISRWPLPPLRAVAAVAHNSPRARMMVLSKDELVVVLLVLWSLLDVFVLP